jgi:hypothetical protein
MAGFLIVSRPMKSKLLILFTFACAVEGLAQKKGTEFQVIINPTFSTRYFSGYSDTFGNTVNEVEKGIISYDAGVLVVPFKTGRFSFGTGVILSRKGFSRLDYTTDNMEQETWRLSRITECLYYLELPLRATYNLSAKAKNYFVLGLSNDVLLSSKTSDEIILVPEKRRYNVGVNIGLGHNFKINDSIVLGLEPNLKFQTMHFLPTDLRAKRYLYTIGLALNTKFAR